MGESLEGKVVIVTGASSGIGAATARLLAQHGCLLTLAARSREKLESIAEDLGPTAMAVPTDVTSGADVEAMVRKTLKARGRIDVMFANAGLYIPGQAIEGDPDAWARLIDVNINGVFRCARAVLPAMTEQGDGFILATSSISGFVDIHWEPIYSASKHAVQGFVHTLRRQVMASGIRVGAVAPGRVANELWGIRDGVDIEQAVREHSSLRSEDVAEAVVFMLSRPRHVTVRDLVLLPQNQDL